ncbi:MAG: tRNA preQ1(34) S-adenosylmethionine ribosyltransferase-isomerase QueA [Vicinamibacterales bacterium]
MNVSDFDFELPEAQIAQEPPAIRGQSRLLRLDRASGATAHHAFGDLPALLRPGDLLVVNDTRVFPARLLGRRLPGGGAVECLLVSETAAPEPGAAESTWTALVHPGQRLRVGSRMEFPADGPVVIEGEVLGRHFNGRRTVRLRTMGGLALQDAIDRIGHVPLPPYIHRDDEPADRDRYQTIFAAARGSIAAPTAGLHFTPEVIAALDARGVERIAVTLHVGYGTFQPIRTDVVEAHRMDAERYEVTAGAAAALSRAAREGRRVVAVGTTTTRTLESLPVAPDGTVAPGSGETALFIHPGHRFRLVSGLVTNFHLPRSSLLMLVSALGGRDAVLSAYREAVARGYRFYSYGDAMLII